MASVRFLSLVLVPLASYLVGSIPFGYLVARWRGVDIFQQGSGNIGATNVGRVLGRRFGIAVFLLDFAKGALPVLAASSIARHQSSLPNDALEVLAGLAAFLGHLFPIYLHFRGGKGVATGAGIVAVLLPGPTSGALISWLAIICLTRYVSLASLTAAVVLCLLRFALVADPFGPDNRILTLFCVLAAVLIFVRHHANISRLIKGRENRLKETTGMILLTKTIHVLALGLWLGSVVFFSFVAAPIIFQTFGGLATEQSQRPTWLPDSLSKEQGTQLAGLAVGPIFPWYYLVQGVCGVLAVITALAFTRWQPHLAVGRIRLFVLALAFATLLVGWPIAYKVGVLREARYGADPALAAAARADFATWHTFSLLLNFATVGLVAVGMALAASLPSGIQTQERERTPPQPNGAQKAEEPVSSS
jgi:acyl-phosphate glycerol 3-phosphate acyltransferase